MYKIEELQNIVNKELAKRYYEEDPLTLFEPMTYALSVGGKRLRPVMVLLTTNMYGGSIDYAMKPAIGLEIFHNFTLLHDDVMDNAGIRRGQPTVFKKWNNNVAILSGDAMSIRAYQYIVSCSDKHIRQVIELFNQTALEVCKGQQMDMDFESLSQVSLAEYLKMIKYKTAVLFACSFKLGGILSDVDKEQQKALSNFGLNLGMAFQLQDDFLDVYGNVELFGKNIGGDILANKKTYLLIKAFEKANKEQSKTIQKVFKDDKISSEEKINTVISIYSKLNIKKDTTDKIHKYVSACKTSLEHLKIEDKHKEMLLSLISELEHRTV